MMLVKDAVEIRRLAHMLATAKVLTYKANHGLLPTMTSERAIRREHKAENDLLRYLESLRDQVEVPHPDYVSAMSHWNALVGQAEERK